MTAIKTANVNARIDKNIKKEAEAILSSIGLPRSVAIDMFYRQIIMHRGLPFSVTLPNITLPARDSLTAAEFNKMMKEGLEQAKADESEDFGSVFDELEDGL